jgi:hypothetical protein
VQARHPKDAAPIRLAPPQEPQSGGKRKQA